MADANIRAAIATIRALDGYDLNLFISFSSNSLLNKIAFWSYIHHTPLYYDKTSKDAFISSLISMKNELGDYTLLPYGEQQLRWAIAEKDHLTKCGITVPTVDVNTYELISDKESFVNLCRKFSIDVPKNGLYDKTKFLQKFVIKPKKLISSSSVLQSPKLIENEKSLSDLNRMDLDLDLHFTQEYISGPSIYYCTCYKEGHNQLSFTQINLHQQPNGKSVIKSAPYELPPDIVIKIDTMFKEIGWDGVVMVELKKDLSSQKYYAIEANPRFWGPLQLSIDNGANFPAILLGFGNRINTPPEARIGYIWLAGYLDGLKIKLITSSEFQKYCYVEDKIKFRDVWFRTDTFCFFFIELLISACSILFGCLWKLKKIVE
ncbi:hypothetical protein AZH53_05530 [Methanomicrobiaceae archaeon CYW5]|uniref:hypothetical protein n=1 Tax=Methanovulcanius yangii TaxID=1789227 RepID=UPI0029C9D031|nr:hypothetical protein [Methanovulcanius yangii]MBT8507873.1 hypothetical protein [Methanovulcanius yangii]